LDVQWRGLSVAVFYLRKALSGNELAELVPENKIRQNRALLNQPSFDWCTANINAQAMLLQKQGFRSVFQARSKTKWPPVKIRVAILWGGKLQACRIAFWAMRHAWAQE
jgi:hypothetical protein